MQGVRQEKIKLPVLVSGIRRSLVKLLNRPASELAGHHAFKSDQKILAVWAADCAEHVLPYFECNHPKDGRPRKAIEACRAWAATGVFRMADIRKASLAAHAAARGMREDAAACYAARAAGQAVATAHVPTHSIGAAAYAIKAAVAYSNDANSIIKERNWQLQRLRNLRRI